MINRKNIKKNNRQIFALLEKELFIELRVKANVITRFLNPIIQLFIYFFLMGVIFNLENVGDLGYWNSNNYALFLLLAFSLQLSRAPTRKYYQLFLTEKYWKTLSALMVAPMNRFTLLFGVLASELIMISIPLISIFIIALVFFPIPFYAAILVLFIFFAIFLIFSSIGLLIGVFGISNEEYVQYSFISLNIVILLGCINYPPQIFPEFIQFVILLNPFYYIFDIFRLSWFMFINFDLAITFITPIHIIMLVILTIGTPIISIYLYDKVYKKHGITGY